MCNSVGTIIPWHKFGYMGFSFTFVVAAVVFGGKHYKVTYFVNIFWCTVFVGVVCLTDFGSKEVVLSLLHINCDMGYDLVSSGLFSSSVCAEQNYQWDYPQGPACLQLEAREAS